MKTLFSRSNFICLLFCGFFLGNPLSLKAAPPPDYKAYAVMLSKYVDDSGLVNYGQLKANLFELNVVLTAFEGVAKEDYETWNEADKIAFWINAYNTFMLKAVCNRYPIEPSFLKSFFYEKNSMQHLSDIWDTIEFAVLGQKLTLSHIQNEILRKQFIEPGIHFGLNSASLGCAPIARVPYEGSQLKSQLTEQAKRFMGNPKNLTIDKKQNLVSLSPLFENYMDDFVKVDTGGGLYSGLDSRQSAIINYIKNFLSAEDQVYLTKTAFKLKFAVYDYSLNEKK